MRVPRELIPSTVARQPVPRHGLSRADVEARRARGQSNAFKLPTSRPYLQILRDNVFTFINTVLYAIAGVLIVLGRIDDAVAIGGLVLFSVVVAVIQEGRAKEKLDHLALLTRPKASVLRDGSEQTINPAEIVLDDVVVARQGDQILADGRLIGDGAMTVDESLLTGESDPVAKRSGDPVYSGSFCITGSALYQVERVGAHSLANQITTSARAFRRVKTVLQRDIDTLIRVIVVLVVQLGILFTVYGYRHSMSVLEGVQMAGVIVALVPQGLLVMITVSYALGAARMAGKGALIQRANAVESMSHVDVLCLDKTGTLTTNALHLQQIQPIEVSKEEMAATIGTFAASVSSGTHTTDAIGAAFPQPSCPFLEEVVFSSDRKWSALSFDTAGVRATQVLGAPEILRPSLVEGYDLSVEIDSWTGQGLRVLLFAHRPEVVSLYTEQEEPILPTKLIPLGLVALADELQPEAESTLRAFQEAGVRLKIISGDHPETVSALATQAEFQQDGAPVSGLDLDHLGNAEFSRVAEEASVFGRITPQQKERLVRALRTQGHYVAMIGDGVNDVLALKQAQLSIAMEKGSQMTRAMADIVLLRNSFGALPAALQEGQRIVQGMYDIMRLLLTRTVYVMLVILGAAIANAPFPVTPKHNTLVAMLTVGIPTVALAWWARPGQPPRNILRVVGPFVVLAAFSVASVALAGYLITVQTTGDVGLARTVVTAVATMCGCVLIVFAEPPIAALADGDKLSGDWRPTALALAMLGLYGLVVLVEPLRTFFQLVPLRTLDIALYLPAVAVWALALRFAWQRHLLERLLGIGTRPISDC